ncbi:serine hydrolase FSH [Aspergillus coremiiformis]|uniref:Serine hydrolase FSH n=1 Tax=Aspergillus coremiiformis TaxID=138285 RepID=A0A5N6ZBV1_9EURO|nr:serine hydrolase FSH [Aspergillus coremiiformis]
MEFLCLPGSFGNENTFKVQLGNHTTPRPRSSNHPLTNPPGPLITELQRTNTAHFHFTQGSILTHPPPEFESYFGPPPHYRFIQVRDDFMSTLRSLPKIRTREQAIHYLETGTKDDLAVQTSRAAVTAILEQIDQNASIQGLIGYSEGAAIAASVMIEEQRRKKETGRPVRIKCAVFISGWPAIDIRSGNCIVPSDEDGEEYIPVPTCHVIGAEDVFLEGSKVLYEICNGENAEFFDHGGGHIIPRNARTLRELGDVIRAMVRDSLG